MQCYCATFLVFFAQSLSMCVSLFLSTHCVIYTHLHTPYTALTTADLGWNIPLYCTTVHDQGPAAATKSLWNVTAHLETRFLHPVFPPVFDIRYWYCTYKHEQVTSVYYTWLHISVHLEDTILTKKYFFQGFIEFRKNKLLQQSKSIQLISSRNSLYTSPCRKEWSDAYFLLLWFCCSYHTEKSALFRNFENHIKHLPVQNDLFINYVNSTTKQIRLWPKAFRKIIWHEEKNSNKHTQWS